MNSAVTNALAAIATAAPIQDWSTIDAQLAILRLQVNDVVTGYIGNSTLVTLGNFMPLLVELRSRGDLLALGAVATQVGELA